MSDNKIQHKSTSSSLLSVRMGTVTCKKDSQGEVWDLVIDCHRTHYYTLRSSTFQRGANSSLLPSSWGVPVDVYLDVISEQTVIADSTQLASSFTQPGLIEVHLTYRSLENIPDASSEIANSTVYERDWISEETPLPNLLLYRAINTMATGDLSFFDYLQLWENAATAGDKQAVWNAVAALSASTGKTAFGNIVLKYQKGFTHKKTYRPVLTKTSKSNTVSASSDIGITDDPSGFGSVKPTGYDWVKVTDRISKDNALSGISHIEQWEGALDWDAIYNAIDAIPGA